MQSPLGPQSYETQSLEMKEKIKLLLWMAIQMASADSSFDESSFDVSVKQGFTFVKFFAPWCGHCQAMAGDWQELQDHFGAEKYSDKGNLAIVQVDCTTSRPVCAREEVHGYPTIRLYQDGNKLSDYQLDRDFESMKDYLHETTGIEEDDDYDADDNSNDEIDVLDIKDMEYASKEEEAEQLAFLTKAIEKNEAEKDQNQSIESLVRQAEIDVERSKRELEQEEDEDEDYYDYAYEDEDASDSEYLGEIKWGDFENDQQLSDFLDAIERNEEAPKVDQESNTNKDLKEEL